MSKSFRRKLELRREAQYQRGVQRTVAGLSRAAQVSRSSVPVGDDDVGLAAGMELGQDVAVTVDYHDGELTDAGTLTDGVIDALPDLADDIVMSDVVAGGAADGVDGVWDSADELAVGESRAADETARVEAEVADIEVQVADAVVAVEEAQTVADGAAADALAAAQASTAAAQAAADAQAAAVAAQGDATQAISDAESKSEAARVAAEAYAFAEAESARLAAIAAAEGDATAKADAAQAAAELAAAADAKTKADAAEAAAKVDAAAAQSTADAAAAAAATAQAGADAAKFLTEGLYQAIPSVSEPTTSPTGALKSGDQWWKIGGPGTEYEGKWYGVAVWNGAAWQDRQLVGNSLLVPGSVGNVLIEDGGITASKIAADFYYGREFYGGKFEGGEFALASISSGSEILNDTFEASVSPWTQFNSDYTLPTRVTSPPAHEGNAAMRCGTFKVGSWHFAAARRPVSATAFPFGGFISGWVRATLGIQVFLGIDSSATSVGTVVQGNVWTEIRYEIAPGAEVPSVYFSTDTTVGPVSLYVDSFRVVKHDTTGGLAGINRDSGATARVFSENNAGDVAELRGGRFVSTFQGGSASYTAEIAPHRTGASPTSGINLELSALWPGNSSVLRVFGDASGGGIEAEDEGGPRSKITLSRKIVFDAESAVINSPVTLPGNTFALKSQLDAWAPIDGTHAWVTSGGREYVRAGGVWVVVPITHIGQAQFSVPSGTGTSTLNVPFPTGLFPDVPVVTLSNNSPFVTIEQSTVRVGARTATGFDLQARHSAATSQTVTVIWQATLN